MLNTRERYKATAQIDYTCLHYEIDKVLKEVIGMPHPTLPFMCCRGVSVPYTIEVPFISCGVAGSYPLLKFTATFVEK